MPSSTLTTTSRRRRPVQSLYVQMVKVAFYGDEKSGTPTRERLIRGGGGGLCREHLGSVVKRHGVPDDPLALLERFPGGLTTQEVAQLLTRGNDAPDRTEAEVAMLALVATGAATRTPLGDDALWEERREQ
jgi:hypothetical protein